MRKSFIGFVFIALIGGHQVSTLKCYACEGVKLTGACKDSESTECTPEAALKSLAKIKAWDSSFDESNVGIDTNAPPTVYSCVDMHDAKSVFKYCTFKVIKACEIKMLGCKADETLKDCGYTCNQCEEDGCNGASIYYVSGYIWLASLLSLLPVGIFYN